MSDINRDQLIKAQRRFFEPIQASDVHEFSICSMCANRTGYRKCKAFKRIPDKFWNGEVDHTTPYSGDNGIVFEPYTS